MKVGLSLSFCVKDIMQGKVELTDVEFLVTGTAMQDFEQFQRGCEQYAQTYWSGNPEQGKFIAKYLWDSRRIHQPRLECAGGNTPLWHHKLVSKGVHWLTY